MKKMDPIWTNPLVSLSVFVKNKTIVITRYITRHEIPLYKSDNNKFLILTLKGILISLFIFYYLTTEIRDFERSEEIPLQLMVSVCFIY